MAWTATGGGDHEGSDWTISSPTTIAGYHYNVGVFTVNTGITATLSNNLKVSAAGINIQGSIDGSAVGNSGGSRGEPGFWYCSVGADCPAVTGWGVFGYAGGTGYGTYGGSGGAGGNRSYAGVDGGNGSWGSDGGYLGSSSNGDNTTDKSISAGSGGGGAGGGGGCYCSSCYGAGCGTPSSGQIGPCYGGYGAAGGAGGSYIWLIASSYINIAGSLITNGQAGLTNYTTGSSNDCGGSGSGGTGGTQGGAGAGGGVLLDCTGPWAINLTGVIDTRGGSFQYSNAGSLKIFSVKGTIQTDSLTKNTSYNNSAGSAYYGYDNTIVYVS